MSLPLNLSPLKRVTRSLNLHFFILGVLFCMLCWFSTESAYETELFNNIHLKMDKTLPPGHNKDSFAVAAMHMTYYLAVRRNEILGDEQFNSIKYRYIHPATVDLMTGNGSCGSYSLVLARILKSNNMKVRFGQMQVLGQPSGHVFIETLTDNGWIVLDPFYDTYFIKPNGQIAGYEDLHNNWQYYKQQVPPQYDSIYNYEDVRYTNWDKFSFLTRGVKQVLNLVMGKTAADKVSLRPYFIRIYNKLAWLVSIALLLVGYRAFRIYRKQRKAVVG